MSDFGYAEEYLLNEISAALAGENVSKSKLTVMLMCYLTESTLWRTGSMDGVEVIFAPINPLLVAIRDVMQRLQDEDKENY